MPVSLSAWQFCQFQEDKKTKSKVAKKCQSIKTAEIEAFVVGLSFFLSVCLSVLRLSLDKFLFVLKHSVG